MLPSAFQSVVAAFIHPHINMSQAQTPVTLLCKRWLRYNFLHFSTIQQAPGFRFGHHSVFFACLRHCLFNYSVSQLDLGGLRIVQTCFQSVADGH